MAVLGLSEDSFAQSKTLDSSNIDKLRKDCSFNESKVKSIILKKGEKFTRFNSALKASFNTKKVELKNGESFEVGHVKKEDFKQKNDFSVYFTQNADTAFYDSNADGSVDRIIINKNNENVEHKKDLALFIASSGITPQKENVQAYFFDVKNNQKVQYIDLGKMDFNFIEGDDAVKIINLTQTKFNENILNLKEDMAL
jgi:hypothetical protein